MVRAILLLAVTLIHVILVDGVCLIFVRYPLMLYSTTGSEFRAKLMIDPDPTFVSIGIMVDHCTDLPFGTWDYGILLDYY